MLKIEEIKIDIIKSIFIGIILSFIMPNINYIIHVAVGIITLILIIKMYLEFKNLYYLPRVNITYFTYLRRFKNYKYMYQIYKITIILSILLVMMALISIYIPILSVILIYLFSFVICFAYKCYWMYKQMVMQ